MSSGGSGSSKSASYTALTYLSLFGLAIATPLLLLLGALLLQSVSVQREQLERRVLQVLDALVNDIDRDLDRDITILRTLATSQAGQETVETSTFVIASLGDFGQFLSPHPSRGVAR